MGLRGILLGANIGQRYSVYVCILDIDSRFQSHAGKAKSFQAYAAAWLAELRRLVPASLGSFKKIQVLSCVGETKDSQVICQCRLIGD